MLLGVDSSPPPIPYTMSNPPSPSISPTSGLDSELPGRLIGQPGMVWPEVPPAMSVSISRSAALAPLVVATAAISSRPSLSKSASAGLGHETTPLLLLATNAIGKPG